MRYLYGDFPDQQIADVKKSIRGSIYFLLLCVDPETSGKYQEININKTFENLLYRLDGFNSLLFYPKEIVDIKVKAYPQHKELYASIQTVSMGRPIISFASLIR